MLRIGFLEDPYLGYKGRSSVEPSSPLVRHPDKGIGRDVEMRRIKSDVGVPPVLQHKGNLRT